MQIYDYHQKPYVKHDAFRLVSLKTLSTIHRSILSAIRNLDLNCKGIIENVSLIDTKTLMEVSPSEGRIITKKAKLIKLVTLNKILQKNALSLAIKKIKF